MRTNCEFEQGNRRQSPTQQLVAVDWHPTNGETGSQNASSVRVEKVSQSVSQLKAEAESTDRQRKSAKREEDQIRVGECTAH